MARRHTPSAQQPLARRPLAGIPDPHAGSATDNTCSERLLTIREAANFLRLSESWLAKARMRGDGPPFVKMGGAIRYLESTLVRWMKAQQRLSITER
jgi:predicted DNA-binding transcriptional regulator AlpA